MFGTIEAPAKIDELRELVRTWRPDLIVHDSADLAAPVAAEEAGVLSVNHSFGRLVPVDVVAAAASAAGLSADPLGGMFRGIYVDIAPPSFQTEALPAGARVEPLRPVPVEPPATERAPEWLDRLPERPTVYVTLGNGLQRPLGVPRPARRARRRRLQRDRHGRSEERPGRAGADPRERARRAVHLAIARPSALPRWPSSTAAPAPRSPRWRTRCRCSSCRRAPTSSRTPRSASRSASAKLLLPDELTVEAARSAVLSLLGEERYQRRARDLADEIEAMPDPAELVPILVDAAV